MLLNNSTAQERHLSAGYPWKPAKKVGPISTVFPSMGIPMLKMRRSRDHLIFNMGIPILVRWHLDIESAPWNLQIKCPCEISKLPVAKRCLDCIPSNMFRLYYFNHLCNILLIRQQVTNITKNKFELHQTHQMLVSTHSLRLQMICLSWIAMNNTENDYPCRRWLWFLWFCKTSRVSFAGNPWMLAGKTDERSAIFDVDWLQTDQIDDISLNVWPVSKLPEI